jgi:hypothetical protein
MMAYSCAWVMESRGSSNVTGRPLTVTKTICTAQSQIADSPASRLCASFHKVDSSVSVTPPQRAEHRFWLHATTRGASYTSCELQNYCWCKWNDKLGCYHVIYEHVMTLRALARQQKIRILQAILETPRQLEITRQRYAYSYTAQNMDPLAIYDLNQRGKQTSLY